MITCVLEALLLALTGVVSVYLIRHYVFTVAVLRASQRLVETSTDGSVFRPVVSILIPVHNEERVIGRTLQRMTELTYPKKRLEIVVIDDASTDDTRTLVEQYAKIHSHIRVFHREASEGSRGKAAALNAAYKETCGEIIVCFDADYYPQLDIVERLVGGFVDKDVGVVQGRVTVLNEPQNVVTRLVALERIGGFRVDQQARDSLGLIPQFGGTVGALRRSLLDQLGGWDETILAEDTDLTFRAYLAGYKVRYDGNAECYEEAVSDWRAYWRQRYRWSYGHMQCAFRHGLSVLLSRRLTLRERVDGWLLLNIYFMPVLALLSLITYFLLFFLKSSQWLTLSWAMVPFAFYSFLGNFAPFFEVGVGAYLDGRTRAHWLVTLLIITFLYNIPICSKALADLLVCKLVTRKRPAWSRTEHFGYGHS